MNGLDGESLEGVRAWAQRRVDEVDRRKRMKPLFDAVMKRGELVMSSLVPDLMAGATAQVRQSVLDMEKSQAEFPRRMEEQEAKYEAELARVRQRTAALRGWLEALS